MNAMDLEGRDRYQRPLGGALQIEPRRAGDLPQATDENADEAPRDLAADVCAQQPENQPTATSSRQSGGPRDLPLGSGGSTPPEQPAFRSELWNPKAATRPVLGSQGSLDENNSADFRVWIHTSSGPRPTAPRSAQRAAATGTQPCISKRAWGPQSGHAAGLGSQGSLDENNSADFRVWIHTSSGPRPTAPRSAQRAAATGTQPCISKRAWGPQSGHAAGLGSQGSLDENNSADFRV